MSHKKITNIQPQRGSLVERKATFPGNGENLEKMRKFKVDGLYIRPLEEVVSDYIFLMGYWIGKQKKWYAGIEGITYIFNGAWSDPEVGYNGYAINETYLDGLWSYYQEECEENGTEVTDEGYLEYLRDNRDLVVETLDNIIEIYEDATRNNCELEREKWSITPLNPIG